MGKWCVEGKWCFDCYDKKLLTGCSGMPTVDGLRRALKRVDAGPDGHNIVYWTSLREVRGLSYQHFSAHISSQEPVIYIAGRPHVLRLVDKPLENVE